MRVVLACLLWTAGFVDGLSPPKFLIKSRSIVSLETASGVKATLPIGKKAEDESSGRNTDESTPKQPYSLLTSLILDENKNYDEIYWYHPQIHTLGNAGILGAVHAALAPLSTHLIDYLAYDGVDIRLKVANELKHLIDKGETRVLDLCCGVGYSTRALRRAIPEAKAVIGVDTSPQMVAMANFLTKHFAIVMPWFQSIKKRFGIGFSLLEEQQGKINAQKNRLFRGVHFKKGNAEKTGYDDQSFDLITVMYAFHEAPLRGREQIMNEARRLLAPGGVLAIVDISSDYEPPPNMLAGEPYVIEYQQNMSKQLRRLKGFLRPKYKVLVPGHVGMWTLRRSLNAV